MIASRTPLRISFCGGGTDFKDYYARHGGAVLSTAIDQYVYLIANKRFEKGIRLGYSQTEIIDRRQQVRHPLFNACMKAAGIDSGIELLSLADIPSKGSGLGSSSSFAVGLLNVLHAYQGKKKPARSLAEQACHVEIGLLREPIGKQDQYAAAFGGLNLFEFNPDETVSVHPTRCSKNSQRELDENLLLFFTGLTRDSKSVLAKQKKNTKKNLVFLHLLKALAYDAYDALHADDLTRFGNLLHKNWLLKKRLAANVSNPLIDQYYARALKAGAVGGKICGSGNGGFLAFYCEKRRQNALRQALRPLKETPFSLEEGGSRIVYEED